MTVKQQPAIPVLVQEMVAVERCIALRRNPQYVSPHAMEALKAAIRRDGFLAPVLLRPFGADYEVVSGNHRVMAARELGITHIPALVGVLTDQQVGRIAVNLNTIHGDPTAELLAPFLADLDDETLATIHMGDDLLKDVLAFDDLLSERLKSATLPDAWDNDSVRSRLPVSCTCPTCGRKHARAGGEGDE